MKNQVILKSIMTVVIFVIAFTMTLPLLWMLSASMKVETDVFKFPIEWIPKRWNVVSNYKEVWGSQYNFAMYYWNSIKITVLATICQVFVSAMGAYGFSKINFKFRDSLFLLYLATIMIPEQVTIVPRFMIFKWLGLFDTHTGLVMMLSFSVYGVFLLRQFMVVIPNSLSESAKIDGANHFRIFMQIILPITKPAIATLSILKFVWTWNDYQHPLIFLSSKEKFTLQLGMKQFASESGEFYSLIMTGAVMAIIPLIIVFIIGQKYVIEGITMGAVKG
ncbi:MAG: multiple sugar transport system permease protein [Petroclostridium sp.]|jgi:multiple sugar transport system permease protein|uniref:carbohydrate ABC transporter permease n=1 Tax=Petroclostridium xylanilyticum TaxID=1792311 RepID=UPI000B986ABF|nr:carbohydrate ABC transporter permease [Petroclostridium xylanilyticum]MBZ4644605.1 sugar transporter ATP-binding protein [Clostridia bacterium]MDK2810879.1 multiple sugar transport system permease protein [Petroclostridium sp.]